VSWPCQPGSFFSVFRPLVLFTAEQKVAPAGLSIGVDLTEGDKQILVDTAYQAVHGFFAQDPEPTTFSSAFDGMGNTVFVGFRVDGVKRGSWSSAGSNLLQTVYDATVNTADDTRYGQLRLDETDKLSIELFILGSEHSWDAGYEPGIHGIRLTDGQHSAMYYNSVAVESGLPPTADLLSRLCQKAGLESDCQNDPGVQLFYFPTMHLLADSPVSGVTTLYRCAVLHDPAALTASLVDTSSDAMQSRLLNDQQTNGVFGYQWDPI